MNKLLLVVFLILTCITLLKANSEEIDKTQSNESNQTPSLETNENQEGEEDTKNEAQCKIPSESNKGDQTETNDVPSTSQNIQNSESEGDASEEQEEIIPCTCGVFLSGQFKKGSKKEPKGLPVLTQEMDTPFMNNALGNRQCTNKCLELIIKHLPKSSDIICATVDRDEVYKERAYLFIKNHSDKWHGTNLSAGREFCCKDNVPYKCPIN